MKMMNIMVMEGILRIKLGKFMMDNGKMVLKMVWGLNIIEMEKQLNI